MVRACDAKLPDLPECIRGRQGAAVTIPGGPIDSTIISEIHNVWGFDMIYLYTAAIPGASEAAKALHQIVVVKMDTPDKEDGTGDEPDSFLEFHCFPDHGGFRIRKTCIEVPGGKFTLVKHERCGGVYGYRIADTVEDWLAKPITFSTGVEFAEALVKTCNLQEAFSDHFKEAYVEINAWHDEVEKEKAAARAAMAT
eukprot:CAMPEP_0183400134 /NCGR_PEP_ID=MMETSP0370-20130417/12397_1 /TAXON_ID=268820 /ORGANISM="Peridinium aciculiferum, Strain PAER-2" /LENGTH=196 /DNA_ID=CAMNT_0025581393 /DNA_START=62 /DNA_END=648 /DNA_ORIENTATION=+